MVGPLPQVSLQRKFFIVAIDYFMKWVEAELFAKITKMNAKFFFWKNIIFRIWITKVFVFDNAKQFNNDGFKLFCSDLAISNHFFSPGQPQANGQVKITNKTI